MHILLDSLTNTEEVVGINVSATALSPAIKNLDLDLESLTIQSTGADCKQVLILELRMGVSNIKNR